MFVTTLPIIFTFIHIFNEWEAVILLATVFGLVYFYTPQTHVSLEPPTRKNWYWFLRSAWTGDMALWQAFWPFFIFVNGLLFYADYRIENLTYTIASWKTTHTMFLFPMIWWAVSVWRCTTHTRYKVFGAAARTMTVYLLIELVLRYYISTQHPNTLFDCQLLIVQYGDCL
jgi:hypothetical protein